jgi:hypothetical protein
VGRRCSATDRLHRRGSQSQIHQINRTSTVSLTWAHHTDMPLIVSNRHFDSGQSPSRRVSKYSHVHRSTPGASLAHAS